jgi:quercetin dioxygenase-like cupin family protein
MKVLHHSDVELEDVTVEGAKGVKVRWAIARGDGAPNFAMRVFEIEKGGHTPYHSHPYEHEVYVLEGKGVLKSEDREYPFKEGYVIFVDPEKQHGFYNTGNSILKFLCLIPHTSSNR